jgi:Domain of unknown function (DUF1990)
VPARCCTRSYTVRITGSSMTPAALIDLVAERLNQVSPEMAVFRKTRGTASALRLGDEFMVRMPGPWDGPVRVVRRDPAAFRLATLDGHLDAGEIEFRAAPDGDTLRFEIESWARAGDRLAALLYNKLRLAKEIQLDMWSHFCIRTAAFGRRPSPGRHHHPHPLGHLARAHRKCHVNTVRACTYSWAARPGDD